MFSPTNKVHRKVGRTKDLSAPLYIFHKKLMSSSTRFATAHIAFTSAVSVERLETAVGRGYVRLESSTDKARF